MSKGSLDSICDEEALEKGRWLFTQACTFVRGVQRLHDLVEYDYPEIAFAGRSNVGKSSLINALVNQNALARTSNTPGRTQQLNFFELGKRLYLVDMPGYGYAKVSKSLLAEWRDLIENYLRGRPTLNRVYLLIDARVGLKEHDIKIMEMLDKTAVSYQLVLTKVDKVTRDQLATLREELTKKLVMHPAAHPYIFSTSSAKGIGIAELRAEIAQFIENV